MGSRTPLQFILCFFVSLFLTIDYNKQWNLLLYSFCPLKSKINSFFCVINFVGVCRAAKKNIISCFLISFTDQVEFFFLQIFI